MTMHKSQYKYQLVEFRQCDMSYWAMKKVIYDDNENPIGVEQPKLTSIEIYDDVISNPRIYASEHNWKDTK